MTAKYEIYKDKAGEHRFRLKSSGEIILVSEGYTSRSACDAGIASVQKNSGSADLYERRESSNGKSYFVLKARNHQIIGKSEMYESAAACENGVSSVMKNASTTTIEDLSSSA